MNSTTTNNMTMTNCDDCAACPTMTSPTFTFETNLAQNFAEVVDEIREENFHLHELLDQRTAEIEDLRRMVLERDATIQSYENTNLYMDGVPIGTDTLMQECEEAILADNGAAEENAWIKAAEEWASVPITNKSKVKVTVRKTKKVPTPEEMLAKTKKLAARESKKAQKEAEKLMAKAAKEAKKAKKQAELLELKAKKDAERALKKIERDAQKAIKLAEKKAEKETKMAEKLALKEAAKEAKMAEKAAAKEAKMAEKAAAKEAKMAEKAAAKEAKMAEKAAAKETKKASVKRATPPMALWQRDNKESISAQVKADTTGDKYMVIVGRIWKNLEEDVQLRYKELSKTEKEALDAAATSATA